MCTGKIIVGVVIGLIVGACIGFVICAFCSISAQADKHIETLTQQELHPEDPNIQKEDE